MANYKVTDTQLANIANAIRAKAQEGERILDSILQEGKKATTSTSTGIGFTNDAGYHTTKRFSLPAGSWISYEGEVESVIVFAQTQTGQGKYTVQQITATGNPFTTGLETSKRVAIQFQASTKPTNIRIFQKAAFPTGFTDLVSRINVPTHTTETLEYTFSEAVAIGYNEYYELAGIKLPANAGSIKSHSSNPNVNFWEPIYDATTEKMYLKNTTSNTTVNFQSGTTISITYDLFETKTEEKSITLTSNKTINAKQSTTIGIEYPTNAGKIVGITFSETFTGSENLIPQIYDILASNQNDASFARSTIIYNKSASGVTIPSGTVITIEYEVF